MGLGGLTLAAVFVMVGGIFVPRLVGRREALVHSREGDRFSSDLRLLSAAATGDAPSARHRTSMPLLRAEVDPETEVTMTSRPALHSPTRPRSATTLRMTSQQTRQLSALKAQRAARVSQTRAAAQRRVVTVSAAATLTALVAALAALSVVSWAWVLLPAMLLAVATVGSRVAAKNIEAARAREEEQFRALQEQVDARGATRMVSVTSAEVRDEPHSVEAKEDSGTAQEENESEVEASESQEKSSVTEVVSVEDQVRTDALRTVVVEDVEEETVEVQKKLSAASSWSVRDLPVPASVRKAKVVRRSIHTDTDLVNVPEVRNRASRPLAATGTGEAAPVNVDYSVDLDAVLEARRAQ